MSQRYINTDFWSDPWVLDTLDADATYLFIYLMTNARCNVIGVYEISNAAIAMESKLDRAKLDKLFTALSDKVSRIDGWVVLHNSIKHQNYRSPKIQKLMANLIAKTPVAVVGQVNIPKDLFQPLLDIHGIDMVSIKKDMVSQKRRDIEKIEKKRKDNTGNVNTVSEKPEKALLTLEESGAVAPADSEREKISRIYYQAIQALKIPVRNHANLKSAITKLSKEIAHEDAMKYLTFMRDHFAKTEWSYKPAINEGLDIYAKRKQIENTMHDYISGNNSKRKIGRVV